MILNYNPSLKDKAKKLRKNMTWSEAKLWVKLKNKQLGYDFHRQKPIDEYIVDFFCPELNLIIELDGTSHTEEKYEYDLKRQIKLESLGLKFLRFSEIDVKDRINDVIYTIEHWIESQQ
ncbi:endonuclease domain-containing protein [Candidatus Dojkabacteria bacterium]|uniref:Endonuclease domain-containing protein n=1 Tax=Candidatus Dojkabacteria bacterium TaxID=2099670 RepID=A0A955LB74_9BACT|nr:endonuclease domain-containing protein [Candidatus Dojkabacteria bacterium]